MEPAVLRGSNSEGMLLAAESGETVSLLVPARDVPPGTRVGSGELPGKLLSFSEFQKMQLVIGKIEGNKADVGQQLQCNNCDANAKDRKIAFYIEGGKALSLRCQDGTYITIDKDLPLGAKVK